MIDTWFTSDTHFGHKGILEFEHAARPFTTIEEMHEVMIAKWNERVKPHDIVYHLGDVVFGERWLVILDRLNGKKKLVMGNHDKYSTSKYLVYFEKLYGVIFWNQCILSHVPVHSNGLGQRWWLNVHGHLHSKCVKTYDAFKKEIDDENYFNVSVEQNNLYPFHADEILKRIAELKIR